MGHRPQKTKTLYAALIGDGYLYGATEDSLGSSATNSYWMGLRLDREPFEIFKLSRVPEDLAEKLIVQGTSDQEFSDGYDATRAAAPYMSKKRLDYWQPDEDDDADADADEIPWDED